MTLFFFGDSYTYGSGLRDCFDKDNCVGPVHSQWAFPTLVAATMNLPYKNLGIPGASNQQIFQSIRVSNIKPDDVAIICWTYWHRNYAFTADGQKQISVYSKDCEPFYAIYDNTALHYTNLLTIEHTNLWLRHKSIPSLNFSIKDQDCKQANAYMLDFMERHAVDRTLDRHFGESSHAIWAALLSEYIAANILLRRIDSIDYVSNQDLQWIGSQYPRVRDSQRILQRARIMHDHERDHWQNI